MKPNSLLLGLFILSVFISCQTIKKAKKTPIIDAIHETEPVQSSQGEDAADDPAIWVHPTEPKKSLIIGTNKKAGLEVYDLKGKRLQFYPVGLVNNVDIRYEFPLKNGQKVDIVACTERSKNEILVFQIVPPNGLKLISQNILSSQKELYGFCLSHDKKNNKYYAFANDKNGTIEQWELMSKDNQKIKGQLVRTLKVNSQPEGMVVDDETSTLYVGEEEKGIWKFNTNPKASAIGTFLIDSGKRNRNLKFDIEGLAIYAKANKKYLLASSQGNNTYAIFDLMKADHYIGSFKIKKGAIDEVKDTDGIAVSSANLGVPFSSGIIVVQDGNNLNEQGHTTTQNFKLVPWEQMEQYFLETKKK